MKIILDFDDTIFNTHSLICRIVTVFKKAGFTEREFFEAYQECKKRMGDFDLKTVVDLLKTKEKIKKEAEVIISETAEFVYADFFDFANNFNKKELVLLSFGTADFQKIKIENSGVVPYFQEVIITQRDKKEDLENILSKNKNEKIFFIDDKAEQIDKAKEKLPQIIAMKMERPQGWHINMKSKLADYVVGSLDEAKEIILGSLNQNR